jgi:hypothetical protein
MADIQEQLRLDIKNELAKLNVVNSPKVYAMFHDRFGKFSPQGYNNLEKRIIQMMIAGQIPPAAVIPQIEMES